MSKTRVSNDQLRRWLLLRNRHFLAVDLLVCAVAPIVALLLRTDGQANLRLYGPTLLLFTALGLLVRPLIFYRRDLYRRFWRYASIDELLLVVRSVVISSLLLFAVYYVTTGLVLPALDVSLPRDMPRSLPLLDALLVLAAVGGTRFSVRVYERMRRRKPSGPLRRVAIMGAGSAGILTAREISHNPQLNLQVVGFFDDDPEKQGVRIDGLPVLGTRDDIPLIVREREIKRIIIAMPRVPGMEIRQIVEICSRVGVETRTLPGMYELIDGSVDVSQIRPVQIDDLLRREPIQTDLGTVQENLAGRRVLVTGGGGSIGSELCRQILRCNPAELIILGHGENSVFEIEQQLRSTVNEQGDKTVLRPVIADIRFPERIRAIFYETRPQTVFHAAAHKHVPLMELNPAEAITNNVLGTRNVVQAATAAGVERFVMISTDKAVNPTNVMGSSKRTAEMLVLDAANQHGKNYSVVRFGNVLGSRGSVIHTFNRQIAAGGPITVTHPEVNRFFMTIPEAVQLVLQASVLCSGGEVYMLDMGEPVLISEMARDLIRLSGLVEGRDIEIKYSGLRPGEKLYEELFVTGEEYGPTAHEKIFVVDNASHFVSASLHTQVQSLAAAANENNGPKIIEGLKRLIPEYSPANGTPEKNTLIGGVENKKPEPESEIYRAEQLALAS